jgi:hypothetical protein
MITRETINFVVNLRCEEKTKMLNTFWKSLLVTPAILGAALVVSSAASAAESAKTLEVSQSASTQWEVPQLQASAPATENNGDVLNQLDKYSSEGQTSTNDQVTNVNELRDVAPTDWAYEALRSLVERYGCIVGYPDRTFRGNRATSRWEFAAGLNACLNTMERLIQENVAVLREDIDKLKRLMEEFRAELAALGARVDNLESRVSFLEDHQFSTTTKLSGEAIFAVSQSFSNGNQAVFQDRVRIALNTSFTGEDRLVTRLAAGNSVPFKVEGDIDTEGGPQSVSFNTGAGLQTWQNTQTGNDIILDWLAYYVPIKFSDDFKLDTYIAATGGIWDDFVPTLNPYFEDYDGGNGALSTFAQRNPIYRIGGGTGIGTSLKLGFLESITGPSSLSVGYLAGNAGDPSDSQGLFNGNYGILGQLNLSPFENFNFGFTYVNAYSNASSPIFGSGALSSASSAAAGGDTLTGISGLVGTNQANLVGFRKVTNSYGVNAAWKPANWISLSAFGSYTNAILTGLGSGDIWTYGGGVAFPDLGKEGNLLGIFAGVEPYFGGAGLVGNINQVNDALGLTGNNALTSSNNLSLSNPIHIEIFYKYQVTDNISITPGFIWVSDSDQLVQGGGNDQYIGTLRGTFTF